MNAFVGLNEKKIVPKDRQKILHSHWNG